MAALAGAAKVADKLIVSKAATPSFGYFFNNIRSGRDAYLSVNELKPAYLPHTVSNAWMNVEANNQGQLLAKHTFKPSRVLKKNDKISVTYEVTMSMS